MSDSEVKGQSHREMKRFAWMLAFLSTVNSAAVTGNISARRLKRSVKRGMHEFPRTVMGSGPNKSTMMDTPGRFGNGVGGVGQPTAWRGVLRA